MQKNLSILRWMYYLLTSLILQIIMVYYLSAQGNSSSPIISSFTIVSVHYGRDRGSEFWGFNYSIKVTDPQGLTDIASVVVTTPLGTQYALKDNNGDGQYGDGGLRELLTPPEVGLFTFSVTDKSGNKATATDTVSAVLDFPKNIFPLNNSIVLTTTPTLSWDPVSGATRYRIFVGEEGGSTIWGDIDITTMTSIVYNFDGRGKILKDGKKYWLDIYTYDIYGNCSRCYYQYFIYSSSPTSPVLSADILGRAVKTLYDGIMESGRHYVRWDGRDANGDLSASGIYLYRMQTASGIRSVHKSNLVR